MGNLGGKHGCLFGGGGGKVGGGGGRGWGGEEIVASAVHTSGQEVKPSLGMRQPVTRARIFKRLWSPRIDPEE
jgi:hypothetical protein